MFLIGQYDSPFVRRVAIALRLYGLAFEHKPWSTFGDADKIAPYNPLLRVPTLVLDDGEALIDSAMILDYLDERVGPDEAVAQRKQLVQLMSRGDKVFRMVEKRKEAIDALLRDSRALVNQLADMAERNQVPMTSALRGLRTVLGTLVKHRDDLAATLKRADPALRLYVNSAGDGPWLGVNAPYMIFPDSYWCLVMKEAIGC